MLPDPWTTCKFGEIASFKNGLNFTKSNEGESIKIVGVSDFQNRTELDNTSDLATIRVATKVRDTELLSSGDLLFVRSNGNKALIGRCLFFPKVTERLVFSGFTIRGRVDRNVIAPIFASYLVRSKVVTDQIFLGGSGTNISNLSQEILASIAIRVPPLPEQERIARVLATWDEAIATTERLLVNSRTQKLALLAATLHTAPATGDVAVKSDNGGFPLSVQPGIPKLPPAPDSWRRVRLGNHLKEVRRPVSVKADDAYTLVTVKRSRGGVQKREVLRGSEIKTPSQFSVLAGDFLISKRQIVHGACGIVPPQLDGALISNEYAVINTDGEIDLDFLKYLSESRYFQQTCFHSSIGVHVEKMIFKTERWLTWPFNIPPLLQQKRIVKILDAATREVELIEGQLVSLRKEKVVLMAQLLTGKRRIRVLESASQPAA